MKPLPAILLSLGVYAFWAAFLLILFLTGCASGPNEKPRWKAYHLEVIE